MGVVLEYGCRHRDFITCALWNDSVGVFTAQGELVGVVTCDPDGVYVWGDAPINYEYIGYGRYDVEIDSKYLALNVIYAYETRRGKKFVFLVGKDKLISMRVGEALPDKMEEQPKTIGLYTLDGTQDKVDVPIIAGKVFGEEKYLPIAQIYGVKNPNLVERIFRFAYDRRGLFHNPKIVLKDRDFIYGHWWTSIGLFKGYDRKGNYGWHITRKDLDCPPAIVYTAGSIEEAWETLKGLLAFEGEKAPDLWLPPPPPDGYVKIRDVFAIEDEKEFTIFYERLYGEGFIEIPIPKDPEARLLASAGWDEKQKEIVEKLLPEILPQAT